MCSLTIFCITMQIPTACLKYSCSSNYVDFIKKMSAIQWYVINSLTKSKAYIYIYDIILSNFYVSLIKDTDPVDISEI